MKGNPGKRRKINHLRPGQNKAKNITRPQHGLMRNDNIHILEGI